MSQSISKSPLFICGFPSGGTDLLKTILNAHPQVYINGEMPFLVSLLKYGYDSNYLFDNNQELIKIQRLLKKLDVWNNLENLEAKIDLKPGESLIFHEVIRYWFNNKDVLVWGNKTPQNSENISELLKLFPEAKFILIIRDVRDVCLSWSKKWGKSMLLCSRKWNNRIKQALTVLTSMNRDKYLILKFEDLLDDTKSQTIKIAEFLDIEWSERMLEHYKFVDKIADGKINYGRKIISTNKEKWKKEVSFRKIKEIEELSFDTLKLVGYDITLARSNRKLSAFLYVLLNMWDLTATVLIGNRYLKKNKIKNRFSSLILELKKRKYLR